MAGCRPNFFRATLGLIAVMAVASGVATAQERLPAQQMAETIVNVCIAGMQTGSVLDAQQFSEQFVVRDVENGETELRHRSGQPWVRLKINGVRPGSCTVTFSDSARNSSQTGADVARRVRERPDLLQASVPSMRGAFTIRGLDRPFDHEHDAYIVYLPVGGMQLFFFVPADATNQTQTTETP